MLDKINIQDVLGIAYKAGEAIMEIYRQDFEVMKKTDHSPLTVADKNSNDIITQGLKALYPDIPFVSEESKQIPYEERKNWEYFWMIDPLDGTKEFIKKNDEFTVNIALIHKDQPVIGVVLQPVTQDVFYAIKGKGCFKLDIQKQPIRLDKDFIHYTDKSAVKVVASRSHLSPEVEEFVETLKQQGKEVDFLSAGSSIKFCLVAEGKADVYPRLALTMEWDTAAAQIVAEEAGRKVLNYDTQLPLSYNKEELFNPWFIVE